mgnify:FL=1
MTVQFTHKVDTDKEVDRYLLIISSDDLAAAHFSISDQQIIREGLLDGKSISDQLLSLALIVKRIEDK